MIFVTVGTPQQPFNRLVKAADDFAAQTNEPVIIQAGTTTYTPLHASFFRWTTSQTMVELTQKSRIVITQASAGAIILALKSDKPLILVPRLSRYKEHYNDHQYQLARALQERGQAVLVENLTVTGLQEAMKQALNRVIVQNNSRENLVNGLKSQLEVWQKQMSHKNDS
jgi:UDP-N-acetylglucosamine transferase subunit ALG13